MICEIDMTIGFQDSIIFKSEKFNYEFEWL